MGKKEKTTKQSKVEQAQKVEKQDKQQAEEVPVDQEESLTIKQKKANDLKLKKTIKKMNAKVKSSVEQKQVIKAVEALKTYSQKAKADNLKKKLLESEEDYVYLNFTLTQVPEKPTPRPQQIKLSNPFNNPKNATRVCVFVKDPAREFKDQIQDLKIPCVAKVIGYDKLKRNFRQFKDKKALLNEYDLFLADLRIYKMLPECLGKEFYSKKKYPYPLKLHGFEGKDLQAQLNKATIATYFMQGNGPNYSLRVGRTSQDAKEIAQNIEDALPQALAYVGYHDDIKFSKLQQVSLKVGESPELPIFNQLQKSELDAYMEIQE